MLGIFGDNDAFMANFEYEVQLGMMIKISFARITNITLHGEYDVIGDGGVNDKMHFAPKPHRTPDTLVFHKGWATGLEASIMSFLSPGLKIDGITIMVKRNGSIKKVLSIEEGILSRVSYSDLDAMNGQIMIKSMELHHSGISEMPL